MSKLRPLARARKGVDRRHPWSINVFLDQFNEELKLKYETTLSELYKRFEKEEIDARWLPALRNMLVVHKFRGRMDFAVGNPPWVRRINVDKEKG